MVSMNLDDAFKKIVFLLGAGASKSAGCKLSDEMLNSLKESINNLSPSDSEFINDKQDFNEIYNFILASLRYQTALKDTSVGNYVNIEDFVMLLRQLIDKEFIVPYPLIGNWNDKILKWEMRNGEVFQNFKTFINMQLVNSWTRFVEEDAREMLNPLLELLGSSENLVLNIFSLNYDLVFEKTFNSDNSRILDTGFAEKRNSENLTRYWATDFNNEMNQTKINLYKLHGSIDWEYIEDSEEVSIKESIDDDREPLIIFGSSTKMLSFDPFLYLLSKFREKLKEATIFIVIGYSFHDKYINNMLIQQLTQNTDEDKPKKMLVVNPQYKDKSPKDFADELKKIQDMKSINDVINFRQISPERIKLIPRYTSDFYKDYFANNASLLLNELEQTEEGDKPFS